MLKLLTEEYPNQCEKFLAPICAGVADDWVITHPVVNELGKFAKGCGVQTNLMGSLGERIVD